MTMNRPDVNAGAWTTPMLSSICRGASGLSKLACANLSARSGEVNTGMHLSSGIKFLMYKFCRLAALAYIRQPLQHRGGAQAREKPGRSWEGESQRAPGATITRLYYEVAEARTQNERFFT